MAPPAVRPARQDDLVELYRLWYETETVGWHDPPAPGWNPWLQFVFDRGRVVVADDGDGTPLGFAACLDHGAFVSLSDCYVHVGTQGQGVGRALLAEILPAERPLATLASSDPRAVPSYLRHGMVPRWPAYYVEVPVDAVRETGATLRVSEGGAHRLVEIYVVGIGGEILDVVAPDGRVLGTATITRTTPHLLWAPGAAVVWSTVADDASTAVDVVEAALAWAAGGGAALVSLQLAGHHPALRRVLSRGGRIIERDTACATAAGLLDGSRCTFYGEAYPP